MLFFLATSSRTQRNLWTVQRRARRAARDALCEKPGLPSPFVAVLDVTGEPFLVHHERGRPVRIEPHREAP